MEFHPLLETDTVPGDSIWYVVASSGEAPAQRVGHCCVPVGTTSDSNGRLFVIGGANPSGTFSDVHALDLDSFAWSRLNGSGFAGRYEHAAFVTASDPASIFVFGGADADGNRNDVQVYNTADDSWSCVKTSGSPPQPRTYHNGVCVGDNFIVYSGGDRESQPVTDKKVHVLNVTKRQWSVLEVRGDSPKSRHGHVMAAVENRIFLHGGMSGSNFFDDLHGLDLDKKTWFHAKVKLPIKPPARAAHGSFVCGADVYIFGGMNQNGALDDMFKLDSKLMEWTQIQLKGPPPANRLDFASCTLRLRVRVASNSVSNPVAESVDALHSGTVAGNGMAPLKIASSGDSHSQVLPNIIDLNLESHIAVESVDVEDELQSSSGVGDVATDSSCMQKENIELGDIERFSCPEPACLVKGSEEALSTRPDDQSVGQQGGCGDSPSAVDKTVLVALVLGGMDTNGEIFDDCLVMGLNDMVECAS